MKKSKVVNLVLITAALATADKLDAQNGAGSDWDKQPEKKVYMRSDSTAQYSRTHHHYGGVGSALLWYYAFRPYGSHSSYGYNRTGYYSRGIASRSNVGTSAVKSTISRGGFGGRAFSRVGS